MDEKEFEDICYICRRPESKAGRMFHLPNNICICDDCMHKTMDAVSQFDYQQMMNNPVFMAGSYSGRVSKKSTISSISGNTSILV